MFTYYAYNSYFIIVLICFQLTYDVKKRGMMVPFKGDRDVCEEFEKACKDSDTAGRLKKYNVAPTCPIKSVRTFVTDFIPIRPAVLNLLTSADPH
jgi:hypothetical protein